MFPAHISLGTVISALHWWYVLTETKCLLGKYPGGGVTEWKPALGSTFPAFLNCIANTAPINTRTGLFKSKMLGQKMSQRAMRWPRVLGFGRSLAEGLGRAVLGQVDTSFPNFIAQSSASWALNPNPSEHICLWLSSLWSSSGPEGRSGARV